MKPAEGLSFLCMVCAEPAGLWAVASERGRRPAGAGPAGRSQALPAGSAWQPGTSAGMWVDSLPGWKGMPTTVPSALGLDLVSLATGHRAPSRPEPPVPPPGGSPPEDSGLAAFCGLALARGLAAGFRSECGRAPGRRRRWACGLTGRRPRGGRFPRSH